MGNRLLPLALALILKPAAAFAEPDLARVDAYVEDAMRAGHVPGMALGIVHGSRIVHLEGFGRAAPDGRAVDPQTPFVLGSLSKSFTALAVMQLAEAGRLELDAPVQRYVPWFRVADPRASSRMTLRHLLNQRSGLSTAAGLPRSYTVPPLDGLVRALAGERLVAAPGERFEYSNANYAVLGLVVEAVAGEPFGAYVRRHLFEPLGMRHSFVSDRAAVGLAEGHQLWFGFPVGVRLPYYESALPAASLISSAADMARYLIAHLNGGRLGATTVLSPLRTADLHAPPEGSSYAMGWVASDRNGVRMVWHNGATGSYTAEMVLVPEDGWGVVLLANAGNVPTSLLVSRAATGVTSLLVGREPPSMSWPVRGIYPMTNAAVLVSTLLVARSVWVLPRLRRRLAGGAPRRVAVVRRVLLLAGLQLALGLALALLLGVSLLEGVPLVVLFLAQPDGMVWLAMSGLALLGAGVARLVIGIRAMRGARNHALHVMI